MSASVIWLAIAVTVQIVPYGRFAVGVSVMEVAGEPLCVKETGVPFGHWIVKALAVALTLSLKLIVIARIECDVGRVSLPAWC